MLKKILIGGAVGASVFGVAAASASALPEIANHGTIVQQSDNLSATCTTGVQFTSLVKDQDLTGVRVYQQDVTNCTGDFAQAVATLKDGSKVYSDIVRLDNTHLDTYLPFAAGVLAGTSIGNSVQNLQLTIAGQIDNPVGPAGDIVGKYGAPVPSTPYHNGQGL